MRWTVGSVDSSAIVAPKTGPSQILPRQRDAEKRSILRNHYLFGKLNPKHIDRLASCIVGKTAKRLSTIGQAGSLGPKVIRLEFVRRHEDVRRRSWRLLAGA